MSNAAAILAMFDAAQAFAGQVVFSRGGDDVQIPAPGSLANGGRYSDAVQFTCGYGSQEARDLSTDAGDQWTAGGAAGVLTFGIDTTDRVYVHSTGDTFTLTASANNKYGFATGATAAGAYAGGWRVTAPFAWRRGPAVCTPAAADLLIDPTGAPASFAVPKYAGTWLSIPTMLRGTGGDADDQVGNCLEFWDCEACDTGFRRIRWGLNASGRVYCTWATAVDDITWAGTAESKLFRFALGFTGAEVPVSALGQKTLTSTYPAPGVLILRRGFLSWLPMFSEMSAILRLTDGTVRGRNISNWVDWMARFAVGGLLDAQDDEGHMLRLCATRMTQGSRVSVFQQWGDPRRGHAIEELLDGGVPVPFSHSVTTEEGGLLGRRMCRVSPESPSSRAWAYQGTRVRSEHELRLTED